MTSTLESSKKPSDILKFFRFSHLDFPQAQISQPFSDLAWIIEQELADGAEKSTALRKLLEAKDAAVRATLNLPD